MKGEHTLVSGAIIGLVIGIVMAAVGGWLSANSILFSIFYVIHWPMLQLAAWIQHASNAPHGWSPSTDFFKWLMAYLGYWAFLGFLAGVGYRVCFRPRHSSRDA